MNDITIEPFSGYQVTIKSPVIYMGFDDLTNGNSVFNILKTNLPGAALVPGMSGKAVLVGLYQLPDVSQTQVLPFTT